MWLGPFLLVASVVAVSGQQGSSGAAPVTSPQGGAAYNAVCCQFANLLSATLQLSAMFAELERSKTQLKMDNLAGTLLR